MNRVENDDLSLLERLFHGPLTRTGWWAVGLAVGFLALFAVMCSWPSRLAAEGQHLRTFWAYPPHSLVVISTGICGTAALPVDPRGQPSSSLAPASRCESAPIPVTFGVLFFTPTWKLMRQEALYEWE